MSLLYHIVVNLVKMLFGGREKVLLLPGVEWFDLSHVIKYKCYCLMKCLDMTDAQRPLACQRLFITVECFHWWDLSEASG